MFSGHPAIWIRRFFEKVRVPCDGEGCWEWTASRFPDRYGKFKLHGRNVRAHRTIWTLTRGPTPDGLCICHHCDNPGCVNPAHLFLGSVADNVADRDAKGRQCRGDAHREAHKGCFRGTGNGRAVLAEADIRKIRATIGVTQDELARRFGVGQAQISRIRRRKLWRHVR
jgi:hypothetical protein